MTLRRSGRVRLAMLLVGLSVMLAACPRVGGGDPSPAPTTVVPTPTSSPVVGTVDVYLQSGNPDDCSEVVAVSRAVLGEPTLAAAMEKLLEGPTAAESASGLGSWFDDSTAGLLISAEVVEDVARVDFQDLRPVIPNASTSCGSAALLAQLDSTAAAFASQSLYSIEGDPQTFYEWLQRSVPEI